MKIFINLSQLLFVIVLLTSCKTSVNNDELKINSEEMESEKMSTAKSKMELKYSCGKDGISEFLSDGWIIVEEYSEEKVCTWKSVPATKDCDMEKDKGCKITIPDTVGEEKTYLLEK